jgi:branched-chain amino acid transport system substrate-binding protein
MGVEAAEHADDPAAIRDAIVQTDYQSLVGPLDWKGGQTNPVPNACTTPLVGGQWKKGSKFKSDLNFVFNQPAPNIPLNSPSSRFTVPSASEGERKFAAAAPSP